MNDGVDLNSRLLEEFIERNSIDRDELGEPPLADTHDPFLDRKRVHLDTDENEDK